MRKQDVAFYQFKESMQNLIFDLEREEDIKIAEDLYSIIFICHEEFLAILRSSISNEKRIESIIESELVDSREKIKKTLESMKEEIKEKPENEEMYNVHIARHVSIREDRFRTLEMEIETLSTGSIVMLLSLIESTLFNLVGEISRRLPGLPEIKSVLQRDKGISRYLKYFENYISTQEENFIVGTKKYNELLYWINIRNNIVHNNNTIKKEITLSSEQFGISISTNNRHGKFKYNSENVLHLGRLCGLILDDCITKGFYQYLDVEVPEWDWLAYEEE